MGRPRGTQEKKTPSGNVSAKNVVFKRRKQGLLKKAQELSILCGVPVLLTVRSPDGELEVWPSDPSQVKSILKRYVNRKNLEKNRPIKTHVQDEEINNLAIVAVDVDLKGKGLSTDNQVEEQQMGCGYQLIENNGEEDDLWDGIECGFDESTMLMMTQNEENFCGERAELIEGSTNASLNNNDHDSFFGWKQGLATLGMNFDDVMLPPPQPSQSCYPDDNGIFDLDNCLGITNGNGEKVQSFGNDNPDFDDVTLPPPQPRQFCHPDDYGIFDLDNCLGIRNENGEKLQSFGNLNSDFGIDDYVYDASTQSMVPRCFPVDQSMVPRYLPVF